MKLVIRDRADIEPDREVTDPTGIASEIERLAGLLDSPPDLVLESLASGMRIQTEEFSYSLMASEFAEIKGAIS